MSLNKQQLHQINMKIQQSDIKVARLEKDSYTLLEWDLLRVTPISITIIIMQSLLHKWHHIILLQLIVGKIYIHMYNCSFAKIWGTRSGDPGNYTETKITWMKRYWLYYLFSAKFIMNSSQTPQIFGKLN